MTSHFDRASDQLVREQQTKTEIASAYGEVEPDRVKIAALNNRVRHYLKRAEVHALLAIVQVLRDIRAAITEARS